MKDQTTTMKQVAIYTRVSTADQNLDLQINDLSEYANKRGWQIYRIFEDKISGTTKTRPQLDQLFKDAKIRKFDIVLVWKFDRFARSLKMLVDSLELFKDLGIDFVSYKESIDTTTSMGRLIFNINSAYAEFEREIIGDRVKAGVANKRAKLATLGDLSWGRKPLDQQIQLKIQQLKTANKSIRVIAKTLGISKTTVLKYLGGGKIRLNG
jgi:DNA invertase Pin-like site-specific DNA recombinase